MRKLMVCCLLVVSIPIFAASPKAKALLQQAEKLDQSGDDAGATKAYIEAVKADSSVESLDLILKYRRSSLGITTDEDRARYKAAGLMTIEALRVYVGHHPEEWAAVRVLSDTCVRFDDTAQTEKLLRQFVARHSDNVEAHRMLVDVYSSQHKTAAALDEAEKLAKLPSCHPEDASRAGSVALDLLSTTYREPSEARSRTLARGEANLRHALEVDPENVDALRHLSLLLRERARTEGDPKQAEMLVKEAVGWGQRADLVSEHQAEARDDAFVRRDWGISIWQGDSYQTVNLSPTMTLKRAPFTIRVFAPSDSPIELNVLDNDAVARRIHGGFRYIEDCVRQKKNVALCGGTGMAEEERNPRKALIVDGDRAHYLYHDSEIDHRWSRVKKALDGGYKLERDVAVLGDTPIEKTKYCRLYLTFVRRDNDSGVLRPDEVMRLVLQFE